VSIRSLDQGDHRVTNTQTPGGSIARRGDRMKVWLGKERLETVAEIHEIRLYNLRKDGRAWRFQAKTDNKDLMRLSAYSGRRTGSPCYHAMRDFIRHLLGTGATRVQTAMGNWTDLDSFLGDLDELYYKNIGSQMFPYHLGEACRCDGAPDGSIKQRMRAVYPKLY